MKKRLLIIFGVIGVIGLIVPQRLKMPVQGASASDYHAQSFWYYPWGKSVTHKGVDIFAKAGTPVMAATQGLVLYSGQLGMGGNVVLVLGPKWRLHYYAHLNEVSVRPLSGVDQGHELGTVGTTGNAAGKPPHLHYSLITLLPYPWRWDGDRQGWKKMFFLNPIDFL